MRDITIVVSEQVLSFALDVADRIMVIEKGSFIHEEDRANVDSAKVAGYLAV
jgi:urea transport system ATP-binding protein